MQGIRDFLERYLNVTPPDAAVRKALVEVILKETNIVIPERAIKIIGSVAYLEIEPIKKSALFMKQGLILKRIEEKLLGKATLTAIR